MRKFMTLIDIEMNRIFKVLLPSLFLYMILVIGNSVLIANRNMDSIKTKAKISGMTLEKYLKDPLYSKCTIQYILNQNNMINIGIAIIIFAVIIYSLVIWYREWFGNNKTIYTLLVLPFNRSRIYMVKFFTIVIMFLCSVSTFILTLIGVYAVNRKIINEDAIQPYFLRDVVGEWGYFSKVFYNKILILICILTIISLLFLFCILERSFRLKGIILGLVLGTLILAINIFIYTQKNLYYIEKKWLIIGVCLISMIGSIIYCNYLLKNKVAV